jgi:hypothetical protein
MPDRQQQKSLRIEFVDVARLLFDGENPRLSALGETKSQDELLEVLWNEMAVSEVALSIAANGYFEEEPLFVVPEQPIEADKERRSILLLKGTVGLLR